jgi:hypothetical protein
MATVNEGWRKTTMIKSVETTERAGHSTGMQRNWPRDLAKAEQRTRALAIQHPMMALGLALLGGYCLGRVLSRS